MFLVFLRFKSEDLKIRNVENQNKKKTKRQIYSVLLKYFSLKENKVIQEKWQQHWHRKWTLQLEEYRAEKTEGILTYKIRLHDNQISCTVIGCSAAYFIRR